MSSVLDTLMGLIERGQHKDGAATARANLEQTWDYPSLVASLPYRYYDDKNDLFINTGTAGFVLELAPLSHMLNPRFWITETLDRHGDGACRRKVSFLVLRVSYL